MSKRSSIMTLLFCLISSLAMGQSYVDVMPGDGTLAAAISAAADGDVLRLIPDAVYTESTLKTIGTIVDKKIAIVVDGDGSAKAKVQLLTDPGEGTSQFFQVGNNGSLLLVGLELDGAVDGVAKASYLVRCYMGEAPQATTLKTIRFENCVVKNLKSNVMDGANTNLVGNVLVDSTIVHNCIIHDTGTLVHFKTASSNYVQVTNSTMYNINSYGLRINGNTNTQRTENPEVHVNYTTWHNIGLKDPREIIVSENAGSFLFEKPFYITNSIFSTITAASNNSKSAINIKMTVGDAMATITNICMWDLGTKKNWLNHTIRDTIRMDPGFADPGNGDFTLPAGSILLTFGTDKKAIGDPHWAGNASAVGNKDLLLPESFTLQQNYPNPFNPSTTIRFALLRSGMTTLVIYDSRGREVARPIHGVLAAGSHQVDFSAKDLASGIYLYRLTSSGQSCSKKMLLVK